MRKVVLSLTGLALLLGGCLTVSLQPLYTDKDIVFEPLMIGRWGDPDDDRKEQWVFEDAGDDSYTVTLQEDGTAKAAFEGRLLRLGDHLFLDLFPKPSGGNDGFYNSHLVPAHSIWRVEISKGSLRLAIMKRDWLELEMREGRLNLPHEDRKEALVLTASTPELQNLVRSHLEECFEWTDPLLQMP
ncbi:MAG: hypothetical protein PHI18_00515 [bacterium]|nr:hypothetical protein [bacterium]